MKPAVAKEQVNVAKYLILVSSGSGRSMGSRCDVIINRYYNVHETLPKMSHRESILDSDLIKFRCPNGCLESTYVIIQDRLPRKILDDSLNLHLKFECPHRHLKCELCSENIQAKDQAVHVSEVCPMRQVVCNQHGCTQSVCFVDLAEHQMINCRFRLVTCLQGCGELVPFLQTGQHMIKYCNNRIIACPYKCGARMVFTDLTRHGFYCRLSVVK